MSGLLNGSRTRSYGSLVLSPLSSVRQRRVEHNIQPEDTLQGLSLKYGVSMEQIKRANRLYTNESIFLKRSLWIPVLSDVDRRSNWVHVVGEDREEEEEEEAQEEDDGGGGGSGRSRAATSATAAAHGLTGSSSDGKQSDDRERTSDLTPVDFFKRLDGLISQSKHAAVKGFQDAEKRVAAIEAACGVSNWRPFTRSQSAVLSSRAQQQQEEEEESHVGVPRTIIKLAKTLRDREDEIFQL